MLFILYITENFIIHHISAGGLVVVSISVTSATSISNNLKEFDIASSQTCRGPCSQGLFLGELGTGFEIL
jgi:hypothetical protein